MQIKVVRLGKRKAIDSSNREVDVRIDWDWEIIINGRNGLSGVTVGSSNYSYTV